MSGGVLSSIANAVSNAAGKVLDVNNSSFQGTLRLMMEQFFRQDVLAGVDEFQGEIVRVIHNPKEFSFSPANFLTDTLQQKQIRYKVWIYDVGNLLTKTSEAPSDDTTDGFIINSLLPDFVVTDSNLSNLSVKDKVSVKFLDSVNFTNGIIVSKANGSPAGSGTSPPQPAGSGGTGNGSPSKPSDAFKNPPLSLPVFDGTPKPLNASKQHEKNIILVIKALRKAGFNNNNFITAVLANIEKETNWQMISESSYSNTSNNRLREVFGVRLQNYNEEQLKELKANNIKFYDAIYGINSGKVGIDFQNNVEGDGYKYRGRGYIGITGKGLYRKASFATLKNNSLVTNPDILNTDREVAAKVLAYYFTNRVPVASKNNNIVLNDSLTAEDAIKLVTSSVGGGLNITKAAEERAIWNEILTKVTNFYPKYIEIVKNN